MSETTHAPWTSLELAHHCVQAALDKKALDPIILDLIKVSSRRGFIKARAVVTKRIKPMRVAGKTIHHVGIPIHWGFKGQTKPGFLANTLTPFVGDGNSFTPEFKTFLVKVEKA